MSKAYHLHCAEYNDLEYGHYLYAWLMISSDWLCYFGVLTPRRRPALGIVIGRGLK